MQVTAVQGRQTEAGHARCCKHGSNRFYCIPWSRAENEGPAGATMERSTSVVVINHRISRSTTYFEPVHAVHERTVTDGEHREQTAYTVASPARPLYRQRQKRRRDCVVIEYRGPTPVISYTISVHVYTRGLSIYLRTCADSETVR